MPKPLHVLNESMMLTGNSGEGLGGIQTKNACIGGRGKVQGSISYTFYLYSKGWFSIVTESRSELESEESLRPCENRKSES